VLIIDIMDTAGLFFALDGLGDGKCGTAEVLVDGLIAVEEVGYVGPGDIADGDLEAVVVEPGVHAFEGRFEAGRENDIANGPALGV